MEVDNFTPEISIIIPVYNVEKYLRRCVDSVLNQTFKNIEIILVNDGSKDNCGKICDEYKQQDSRVKVFHKENGGLSSARNSGLEIAKGQFIGFVDSDDWVASDMYEHLYNIITENECDIAKCDAQKVSSSKDIRNNNDKAKIEILTKDEAIFLLLKTSKMLPVWVRLYKAALFKDIRFPEGRINEDLLSSYQLFSNCKKIVVSNSKKYYYFQGNVSITRSGLGYKDFDYIYACDQILELVTKENMKFKKYAEHKRHRAAFTLLAKLAYFGPDINNSNVDEQRKSLLKELRANIVSLLFSSVIPMNRKILMILVCINFNLLKVVFMIYKRTKQFF